LVLAKSLLSNLSIFYRAYPGASVGPGVVVASTLLADNENGTCTLSAETMGKLFGRHPRKIHEARAQALDAGVLASEPLSGRQSRYSPVVPNAIAADPSASLVWQVDAIAGPRRRPGRPRKPLPDAADGFQKTPAGQTRKPLSDAAANFTKDDFAKVSGAPPPHARKPMTEDWQPTAATVASIKECLDVTDMQIAAKIDKLRSHYLGSPRVANWDAELVDWLVKDYPAKKQQVAPGAGSLDAQRTWVKSWKKLGPIGWPNDVGPPPDQPGCRVDPSVLAEHGLAPPVSDGRAA
jgi:hypothetical protein